MTSKEIFENVRYFIEKILKNAVFDNDWNRESLKNAIHWAQYCEKLYHQTQGKSFSKKLDNFIRSLSSISIIPILNFEVLKNSTHILYMALLQNPYLARDLMSIILQENHTDETFVKDLGNLVQLKSNFLVLEEWTKLHQHLNCLVIAELQLECLINKFLATKDKSQKEKIINNFFYLSLHSKNGLLYLLEIWSMQVSNSEIKEIQTILMELLLAKINPEESEYDENIAMTFWNQKPKILSKLSAFSFPFFKIYCNYLICCAQKFELNFISNGCQWIIRENNEDCLDYSNVLSHFVSLMNINNEIQEYIFKLLLKLSAESVCSIWEDIINELK